MPTQTDFETDFAHLATVADYPILSTSGTTPTNAAHALYAIAPSLRTDLARQLQVRPLMRIVPQPRAAAAGAVQTRRSWLQLDRSVIRLEATAADSVRKRSAALSNAREAQRRSV